MGIMWKCCLRMLKENKARTAVTIIGVAMAAILITVLSCIGTSILFSAGQFVRQTNGSAHETYYGVSADDLKYFQNNQAIEEMWMKKNVGNYSFSLNGLEVEKDSYGHECLLSVNCTQEGWFSSQGLRLFSGRYAGKEGEVVLPRSVRTELGLDVNIGDTIEAKQGEESVLFQVVGFVEHDDMGIEFDEAYDDFDTYTDMEKKIAYRLIPAYGLWREEDCREGKYDVSLRFTKWGLARQEEVTAGLLGISTELYQSKVKHYYDIRSQRGDGIPVRVDKYVQNDVLVNLDGISPFHPTMLTVWGIAFAEIVFLLFVLAGVFCINNSFDISITERIRFYGMISSVGTTKRQRRTLVWMEAFVIGVIGIPLGILLGVGLSLALIVVINFILKTYVASIRFVMIFRLAWWAILIAVLQSVFMIALSAMEAASRASKISPIEAIRLSSVTDGMKMRRTSKLVKNVLGVSGEIAWRSFRRGRVKYRATIVSIAVSVAMVLGMNFIPFLFLYLQGELQGTLDYQVFVSIDQAEGYEKMKEISRWDGVTGAVLQRRAVYVYREDPAREDKDKWVFSYVIVALENDIFDKICRENGINPGDVYGKGLIANDSKLKWKAGEACEGVVFEAFQKRGEEPGIPAFVEIAGSIDKDKLGRFYIFQPEYSVFVNESWAQQHLEIFDGGAYGYFVCEDAGAFTKTLKEAAILNSDMFNYDQVYQLIRLGKVLVLTFMAGFLGLISIIGITNVINAVNFNLQMRAPEFARLRAVGMTSRQFRTMIHMEGGFIAFKGLLWGYLIGLGTYYGLHRFFVGSADMLWIYTGDYTWKPDFAFRVPWGQIVLCALVVGGLLWCVMNVHVKKVEKRNVIETIRNENL